MKVICAGMSKTGTKSLNAAFTEIGWKVYDTPDHFYYLRKQWNRIFEGIVDIDEIRNMYQDVDAVSDFPAFLFWEELLQAFPEAKVVLMIRDTEEQWFTSLRDQIKQLQVPFVVSLLQLLSPTSRALADYSASAARIIYGDKPYSTLFPRPPNKWVLINAYRRHNSNVIQRCPQEKLLVYNVKEGWGPLCEFLGVNEPDAKFPHKNVKGDIIKEIMEHPLFKQINKEMKIIITSCTGMVILGVCAIWRYGLISRMV